MQLIKKILPVFLTAAFLTISLGGLSILVSPKNNTQDAGHDAWAAYGFEAEPEDVIDTVILGDSESRTSVSPIEMYHDVGITCYCCGINSEDLCDSRQMLLRVLRSQKPKLVILETNVIFTSFDWKRDLLSVAGSIFPVIVWHDRWKSLKKEDFGRVPDYTSVEARKGYYHARVYNEAPTYLKDNYMTESSDLEPLDGINRHVLAQIASICRENGINLLLLSTPSVKNWNMPRHNTCEKEAEYLNEKAAGSGVSVEYVDMNLMTDVIPIDWDLDTRDEGDHLNNDGMRKVCAWLGPYLAQHYQLKDHRDDPACRKTWTDMYDEYLRQIS